MFSHAENFDPFNEIPKQKAALTCIRGLFVWELGSRRPQRETMKSMFFIPKIKKEMHKNKIDIGEQIFQKLKEKERTMVWLAKQVGCNESNLRKTLKNSQFVYCDLLLRISEALEEDFFTCYSHYLQGK